MKESESSATLPPTLISHPFFENGENQHPVRIYGTPEDPWFALVDVCSVLALDQPSRAVATLSPDERITLTNSNGNPRAGIPHQLTLINESGLYALIFKSRKPQAKTFRYWVTSEVLPTLRRKGICAMPGAAPAVDMSGLTEVLSTLTSVVSQLAAQQAMLLSFLEASTPSPAPSWPLPHQGRAGASPRAAESFRRMPASPVGVRVVMDDAATLARLLLSRYITTPGETARVSLSAIHALCHESALFTEVLPPAGARAVLTSLGYHLRQSWPTSVFPHPGDAAFIYVIRPVPGTRHSTWDLTPMQSPN